MKKLIVALLLVGCGNDIANKSSSKVDSDNDNSVININQDDNNTKGCNGTGQGFLWKPVSESDGFPVVLFPSNTEQFEAVYINTINGEIAQARFSGLTNGNRQTWRFDVASELMVSPLFYQTSNETCTVVIENVNERQE